MKIPYILGIVALLLASGWGTAGEKPAADAKLPVPPQQDAPWSMTTKVPDPKGELKAAVDAMFKLGIADPRGCAYHHLTVQEDGKIHEARGWVLPASQDDTTRYAIGWNGLIYPVESIGKEADLAADVGILRKKGAFEEPPFDNFQAETLDKILSEFSATPRMMRAWAAPYLLLRLGADITIYEGSDDTYDNPFAEKTPATEHPGYSTSLYLDADHWQLVSFARLIRGDGVACVIDKKDWLAAMRLQAFDRVWAEVVKRIPDEEDGKRQLNSSWRSLLADSQRRLSPSKVVADSEVSREIATWDELENWNRESPPATYEKVVAAGTTAIAPLIDCLEHDLRWTRIREDDGMIHGDGRVFLHFVRVRDIALRALNQILRFDVIETSLYDIPAEDSWYVDATARVKMICQTYGNSSGAELWYRILGDENAYIDDQFQAAMRIVRPRYDVPDYLDGGPYLLHDSKALVDFIDSAPSLEGEKLRARLDPSVMDLLQRAWRKSRMLTDKAIAEGVALSEFPCYPGASPSTIFDQSHELVLLILAWQRGNSHVFKEHYDWLAKALAEDRTARNINDYLVSTLCEETLVVRFWVDDKMAMPDYEKLFRSSFKFNRVPIDVMRVSPNVPGMDALAKEAFLGDKATLSFVHLPWKQHDSRETLIKHYFHDDQPSPLLVLPSYRRALIEALQTKTKQGTLLVTEAGCSIKYDADAPEPTSNTPAKPTLPGTGQLVRLCDIVADLLTPKQGPQVWASPRFRLQDAIPERDRAIEQWIKILSATDP